MRYTKRQMEHVAFVATQPSLLLSEDWLEQDANHKRDRETVEQLQKWLDDASRNRDELHAEIKRLRAEVAWWAGEGQVDRPEIVEWKLLCGKAQPTSDEEKRITEISKMIRREHEDAPELRAEIEQLCAELKPLELQNKSQANVIHALMKESKRLTTLRKAAAAAADAWELWSMREEGEQEFLDTIANLRQAAGIESPPADEADDGPKPSHFLAFPYRSLLLKTEAETVAQNIMVICKRRGDRWGELTREDYRKERYLDGDYSSGELVYFDAVYPMIDSAAGAVSFSSMWNKEIQ